MDETVLTSLCSICYIDPPIYTCPRCQADTCSLNCSKRHKIWSSCNGIRDPTVYKPISQVATPSGIDHDYNFLHSIEHGISRSEKVLIEDLSLVSREELKRARTGEDDKFVGRKKHKRFNQESPADFCISKLAQEKNIQILRAPKGMRRNKENTTSWNRKRKMVDWQVEWLQIGSTGTDRLLHKASGTKPIGDQYDSICEEERWMKMTEDERCEAKKRKIQKSKDLTTKKLRTAAELLLKSPLGLLQDSERMTWNLRLNGGISYEISREKEKVPLKTTRKYDFYIHRPLTPASFPKVLAIIDPEKTLTENLAGRCVLEFPTIYVFEKESPGLPDGFISEQEFNEAIKKTHSSQQQQNHTNNCIGDVKKESSNISLESTESSNEDSDINSDNSSSSSNSRCNIKEEMEN
ncbi:Box C/D snoRNA protein 1 [Erysiphe neolycopersici]|uniref:Box C/D snoRNA protein 1 n=1 Tax=Erysiphe neolycopersici TaxID=212602 RepID=A0A420HP02_9PEZI|nr:Box C/D snoRNA protein 1 [Erysiphe neolycopersici]